MSASGFRSLLKKERLTLGAIYLTDLADVLRAAGLKVEEVAGWQTRARSSGGYNRVHGICVHHTASGPSSDGWPSVNYGTFHAPGKPIANLWLDRAGTWWVSAGGAANTQGTGGPYLDIPKDAANSRTLAIEIQNNGIGEAYPAAQQLSLLHGLAVLWNNYSGRFNWGNDWRRLYSHFEWTNAHPDTYGRKCDPTGPSMWSNNPVNRQGCNYASRWWMDQLRASVAKHAGELVSPPKPPVVPPPSTLPPDSLRAGVPLPTLKVGSSGDEVRKLIDVLKFWKWYPAQFANDVNNGQYGERTQTGTKTMQAALKVNAHGVYDNASALAYSNFLDVIHGTVPPPVQPPVAIGMFFIQPGDTYWKISAVAYGTGSKYQQVQAANGNATLSPGSRAKVPGIKGVDTEVKLGEGPYSIIKRCGVAATSDNIETFYEWNGGSSRVLRPGDAVFVVSP